MSIENQITLKNDGWEIKIIDVEKYVAGKGKEVRVLSKLELAKIVEILQNQSYANTDLVVIDIGDMRKLIELILTNSTESLKAKDSIIFKVA